MFPDAKDPGPFPLVTHDLHSAPHLMPNMAAQALAITSASQLAGRRKREEKGQAPALEGTSASIPLARTLSSEHTLLQGLESGSSVQRRGGEEMNHSRGGAAISGHLGTEPSQ